MGCSGFCEMQIIEEGDEINIGNINYKVILKLARGKASELFKLDRLGKLDNESVEDKKYYVLKWKKINGKEDLNESRNEVNILSKFKENNEYIIKYIDFKEEKEHFSIVMEFFGNSNLKDFISKFSDNNKLIEEKQIENIIEQICYGLREIHKSNIIHRDLSPDNILIDENNHIKIIDFGVSEELKDDNELICENPVGKHEYIAPEMKKGKRYNNKIDIYHI